MTPLAADDPMTLWSAAVGDAAAAMKGGLSLANQGEARCGRARAVAHSSPIARKTYVAVVKLSQSVDPSKVEALEKALSGAVVSQRTPSRI
ncbi:MAG: hypothetical protein LM580_10710, partial [Thermofilum sp.]|nr:hypothetical protein [Thermofilum sp.]